MTPETLNRLNWVGLALTIVGGVVGIALISTDKIAALWTIWATVAFGILVMVSVIRNTGRY